MSIVTPTFRAERFLDATITSVLNQQYPALEYVIQDGGSDDATLSIVERHRSFLASVESAPDTGQPDALNRAFRRTEGEVMAFLNADDIYLPGTLRRVGKFFAQNPDADVVFSHRLIVDEDGKQIGRWILPPFSRRALRWVDFIPQETVFWRRRIWERLPQGVDATLDMAFDWDLWIRMSAAGAAFVRLPDFHAAFRVHVGQKTSAGFDGAGRRDMATVRQRVHARHIGRAEAAGRSLPYVGRRIVATAGYRVRELCAPSDSLAESRA